MTFTPTPISEDSVAGRIKKLESGVIGVLSVVQAQIHWSTLQASAPDSSVLRPVPWPGPFPINPAADKCQVFMPFSAGHLAGDTVTINESLALTREWLNKLVALCDEIAGELPDIS